MGEACPGLDLQAQEGAVTITAAFGTRVPPPTLAKGGGAGGRRPEAMLRVASNWRDWKWIAREEVA